MEHAYQARMREASQLASEAMALIESIGDSNLTVGLSVQLAYAKLQNAEWSDVLRWSQTAIDLADCDPSRGNLITGSPLAIAFALRAIARYGLGRPGWRDDQRRGLAMARSVDPRTYAGAVMYVYGAAIPNGVLRPDDSAMRQIEDALEGVEQFGDEFALVLARLTLGLALLNRRAAPSVAAGRSFSRTSAKCS